MNSSAQSMEWNSLALNFSITQSNSFPFSNPFHKEASQRMEWSSLALNSSLSQSNSLPFSNPPHKEAPQRMGNGDGYLGLDVSNVAQEQQSLKGGVEEFIYLSPSKTSRWRPRLWFSEFPKSIFGQVRKLTEANLRFSAIFGISENFRIYMKPFRSFR